MSIISPLESIFISFPVYFLLRLDITGFSGQSLGGFSNVLPSLGFTLFSNLLAFPKSLAKRGKGREARKGLPASCFPVNLSTSHPRSSSSLCSSYRPSSIYSLLKTSLPRIFSSLLTFPSFPSVVAKFYF